MMADTLEQIRRRGLAALRRELGKAGMIRFLQQFDQGEGDYAAKRHEWVDETSLADLRAEARRRQSGRRR